MNTKLVVIKYLRPVLAAFLCASSMMSTVASASGMAVTEGSPQAITGTVTLWYSYPTGGLEEQALLQVITNAETNFPGLTVDQTQMPWDGIIDAYSTAVEGGGGPDLLLFSNDWMGELAREGLIKNINTELVGNLDVAHLQYSAVEGMKVNGEFYGVPESAVAVALYYNKSTVPTPPTTTAELLALVQTGKKLVIPNGDAGGPYFNFGFFGAFGGDLLDPSGRCIADHGGFTPAMQYLVDLKNAGATVVSNYLDGAIIPFQAETIDMYIDGIWNLADNQASLGTKLGLVLLPAGPVRAAAPMNGIDGFYVNPNSIQVTDAVNLALYMTNQASSQIFTDVGGHAPVRTDVTTSDPLINTFALASVQGYPRPQGGEMDGYWGPFSTMINRVLAGTISPGAGVVTACEEMNTLNGFLTYKTFIPVTQR